LTSFCESPCPVLMSGAERQARYRVRHRSSVAAYQRDYYAKNKTAICNRRKELRDRDGIREAEAERARKWRKENPDKASEARRRQRRKMSDAQKLVNSLRRRLRRLVRGGRRDHMVDLIGCTADELKHHIEKQFEEGMSWEDRRRWHLDHIVPCSAFDLSDPEQQRACFHYTNLQPRWAVDNLRKGGVTRT